MNDRTSLVEQKRIQWAMEREDMARLSCASWGTTGEPANDAVRTAVRTRMSARSSLGSPTSRGIRVAGGSRLLRASLISLRDAVGAENREENATALKRRSPSLPPIYTRESGIPRQQLSSKQFQAGQAGSRYHGPDHARSNHRNNCLLRNHIRRNHRRGSPRDDLEDETSGYASDSADVPLPAVVGLLPNSEPPETAMSENDSQNPRDYDYATPESSLPPSRRLSAVRGCAEVRPRWGSVWGQESVRGDPPPPSWLERGLSRMDHTSQVLVINHESASSPDSSTTGSAGSDSNKTYLRGQNVPLDEGVLQEREAKRQRALELQSAIKHQLEERDRRRKEEKQQRLEEERAEEERIERERDEEKQRFEEEQRRFKEKEEAKCKNAEAMRRVLETAERLAKEEKQFRRKRSEQPNVVNNNENSSGIVALETSARQRTSSSGMSEKNSDRSPVGENLRLRDREHRSREELADIGGCLENEFGKGCSGACDNDGLEQKFDAMMRLPASTEIAIVLSGGPRDREILNASNLQVNLVVTPNPKKSQSVSNLFGIGETFLPNLTSRAAVPDVGESRYTGTTNTRLLTPSKYRTTLGREFATQTDVNDLQDTVSSYKPVSTKERKESLTANWRDIEKSTNTGLAEELSMKTVSRPKAQSRASLETRPRWNANRPGTRYRTQSEKDPHYQRRLRLRRRRVDSSDEGSRSPSLERRKPNNLKSKSRNAARRKIKLDSYDADLSMDSLNSILPLRVDKTGRIEHLENNKNDRRNESQSTEISVDERGLPIKDGGDENSDAWCGREILTRLTNLRNGLTMKRKEWDSERCLVSPNVEFY